MKMCKNLEISDKKKRVGSRACALTRRTTTAAYIYIYIYIYIYKQKIPLERTTRLARSRSPIIYRKFRSNERLGWLAPARQLLEAMQCIIGERERPNRAEVR